MIIATTRKKQRMKTKKKSKLGGVGGWTRECERERERIRTPTMAVRTALGKLGIRNSCN
jgi:hypothetical protein